MKTAEQVLENYDSDVYAEGPLYSESGYSHNQVIAAMEEYASYWKQRCILAEKCLEESPCDPDITADQIAAHNAYNTFLNTNH